MAAARDVTVTGLSGPARRERLERPRTATRTRDPALRVRDFAEVDDGFDAARARTEADRCLRCPTARCVAACPVGLRIDVLLALLADGDLAAAGAVLHRDHALPGVCGRVCPQEDQCEAACVLASRDRPIAIGQIERFLADACPPPVNQADGLPADADRDGAGLPEGATAAGPGHTDSATPGTARGSSPRAGRVAIVGSGPAGLAAARDLADAGCDVVVFEALHAFGGVLAYGIPSFRLPRAVLTAEVGRIRAAGVRLQPNTPIGPAGTLDDLLGEHDAVLLAAGAGVPRMLEVPGEDLLGVYSANEFLTRVNLMGAHEPASHTPLTAVQGRRVVVFGGGNTALDCARVAVRLDAGEVTIAYRRGRAHLPARDAEIAHALEEGVHIEPCVAPTALTGRNGQLSGVDLVRMDLIEQPSGRPRPVPRPGSGFPVPADLAVIAIGTRPHALARRAHPDLVTTEDGTVVVEEATGATSKPGVYAAGDIVSGGTTVIEAMGAGRRAAAAIIERLSCSTPPAPARTSPP